MTTFPYGYARPPNGGPQGMGTMLTWEQMMTKTTVYNLHPEVQRRFHALIDYAATQAACRSVSAPAGACNPTRHRLGSPSLATRGTSLSGQSDVGHGVRHRHRAQHLVGLDRPQLRRVRAAHLHVRQQRAVARPADRDPDRAQVRHDAAALSTWALPTEPTRRSRLHRSTPPPQEETFTLDLQKNELTPAKRDAAARQRRRVPHPADRAGSLQAARQPGYDCGKPDGDYGPRTQDAVKQLQADGGLTAGRQVWPEDVGLHPQQERRA